MADGNCYYRQFSGPVHLSWYGVKDAASSPECYDFNTGFSMTCDATQKLKDALKAAAVDAHLGGDGGVTTDGRSIAILTDNVEIKSDQYLTCDGPVGATRGQGDPAPPPAQPYWTLPHSIVLHPGHPGDPDDPGYTILRDQNTRYWGCIERPDWYYPRDADHGGFNIPAQNVRDTVNIVRQFTGTATTCDGRACNMDRTFILGFDTCDDTSQSNKAIIADVVEACLDNEWLHDNGGGMKLQNFSGGSYLEGGFSDTATSQQWKITKVGQTGTDGVLVTIDTTGKPAANNPAPDDTVLISGLGQGTVAPVSANGRWLVSSVTQEPPPNDNLYDVALVGASWAGPTYTGSSWKAGAPAITVYDTTNIIPGQYVCASGTPPFCTPPSGFGSTPVTLGAGITGGYTGDVAISGSPQGWPYKGIAQVEMEDISYTLKDATHITITARGVRNTSNVGHVAGVSVAAAAPQVVGVVPTSEAVLVSAPAQTTSSGDVTFANDTLGMTSVSGDNLGNFVLSPAYHTWTANAAMGSNPSGTVTIHASGSGSTITPGNNCFKIQPNMSVYDLTASASLPSVTHVDCTTNTVTVGGTLSTFTNDQIRFSGCGYPGFPNVDTGNPEPWLGNCAATSVMLGGPGDSGDDSGGDLGDAALGTFCETVHTNAAEIAFHALNASADNCLNMILDDSGPDGAHADPASVGLWLDGKVTKSQFGHARLSGYVTSILDSPSAGAQPDGVGISNAQIFGNIVLGADANIGLGLLHGQVNPPESGFLFAPGSIQAAHIDGTQLPQWSVYVDDPLALPKLYCAANFFANAPCTQVKGTPTCISGCGTIGGNDSNFDVTVSGLGTTPITIQLAGAYAVAPICSISAGTGSGGAVASASISGVAWQPWGTTLTFKVSGPPVHVYGSCHGATG